MRLGAVNYIISAVGGIMVVSTIIYLHIYYFIPAFLKKRKYFFYLLTVVLSDLFYFLSSSLISYVIRLNSLNIPFRKAILKNQVKFFRPEKSLLLQMLFTGLFFILIAYLLYIILEWIDQRFQIQHLEIEKKNAENKYLKSQLNPHFLFNSLNNLHSLIVTNSDHASRALLQLSDFLKYTVYESSADVISLEKEVSMLKDYIALEKLRIDNTKKITLSVFLENQDYGIAPLLLLPLVENGIKHGLNKVEDNAFLEIRINQVEKALQVDVINACLNPTSPHPGIGIINLKKRLAMQYPNTHTLTINHTADVYHVTLKILLDEISHRNNR